MWNNPEQFLEAAWKVDLGMLIWKWFFNHASAQKEEAFLTTTLGSTFYDIGRNNDNGVVPNEHKVFSYMYLDTTTFWFLFVV